VLNGVTSDNDILADTVNDYGPCLNDEGETDAPVGIRVRPCNLSPTCQWAGENPARLDPMQIRVCAKSLVLRAYNRNGDGRHKE